MGAIDGLKLGNIFQSNYNPAINNNNEKVGGYNPGINGGFSGSPEDTEIHKFKEELGLGKTQGIQSVDKNQYVTNPNLYSSVSRLGTRELSPKYGPDEHKIDLKA